MLKLATDIDTIITNIERLSREIGDFPELSDRLGTVHAFYVLDEDALEPKFGFSKFVGYQAVTPRIYIDNHKKMSGTVTEKALAPFFDEVTPETAAYRELFTKLTDWLGSFGKRPRTGNVQKVRLMVVRPEYRATKNGSETRKLLDLLIAVADMLPAAQRHELRAAL